MTFVSLQKLATDLQSHKSPLIEQVGLIPQANDRPLEAGDLLFYLSETSMPMATFLRKHGLFLSDDGLHFDVTQFGAIRSMANRVITERKANNFAGVWKELDIDTDEDVDNDGGYILTALAVLEFLYGAHGDPQT